MDGRFMKQNNEIKTEKKTIKEIIKENKKKILIGVTTITVGVLSYITFKDAFEVIEEYDIDFEVDTVKEEALKEAIMAINRKINYRIDKIGCSLNDASKDKYREELGDLMIKLENFTKEFNSISLE